jgi:release factor glutamine methyltransferase
MGRMKNQQTPFATPTSWTIRTLLGVTTEYLSKKEIESPRLTAEILLAHQLRMDRVKLYLRFDQPLNEREVAGYREIVRRRLRREPIQYITGVQEFWSLPFAVNRHVLIPRPETELLVELGRDRLQEMHPSEEDSPRVLDLGSGCGAVAVAVAKESPRARIWASDISGPALETARQNAETHGVSDRILFLQGDLWQPAGDLTFDLILSNPPYVAKEEYDTLPPEIRDHEPRAALDGGAGGYVYIHRIIEAAFRHMVPGGWVMVEMAPGQTERAVNAFSAAGEYEDVQRVKDYSRQDRVVMARKR